jgi:hypothetical protein
MICPLRPVGGQFPANAASSEEAFGDTHMRVGEVEPEFLNVIQTLSDIDPWRGLAKIHFHRLNRTPRAMLQWQIASCGVLRESEHATGASKDMDLHLCKPPSLFSAHLRATR